MEGELDLLLGRVIDSLVKLEILLYLHPRPGTVQTPADLALALRRPVQHVAAALKQLAAVDLVERFPLGTGKHVIYGPSEDPHVQGLLDLLHERYHRDPEARAQLVRAAAGLRSEQAPRPPGDSNSRPQQS